MKVSLVVDDGVHKGKVIPITLTQFLIGRDPQCQLRPASPMISKRHCAILIRAGQVFIRDFDSTNGTMINNEPFKGEREVKNEDHLKIGPLAFVVRIAGVPPVSKPTPPPPTKSAAAKPAAVMTEDESAGAFLSMQDDSNGSTPPGPVDSYGVPTGSTVLEMPAIPEDPSQADKPAEKATPAKADLPNTSTAAKQILEKYTRRKRTV